MIDAVQKHDYYAIEAQRLSVDGDSYGGKRQIDTEDSGTGG